MFDWEELWLSEGFATYFVYDFLNEQHSHLTENEYYMRLNDLFDRQVNKNVIFLVIMNFLIQKMLFFLHPYRATLFIYNIKNNPL